MVREMDSLQVKTFSLQQALSSLTLQPLEEGNHGPMENVLANINHNSNYKVITVVHFQNNDRVLTILNFTLTKYQKLCNYHMST